jgi:hypothetical protein
MTCFNRIHIIDFERKREYEPIGTSIGCDDFKASGTRNRANVSATNCVQISNSG